MTHAELLRSHADTALREGGMYYSGEYLNRIATVAESLEAENVKLRELVRFIMHQCNDGNPRCDDCIEWNDGECVALLRMRELGVEVGQ